MYDVTVILRLATEPGYLAIEAVHITDHKVV